MYEYCIATLICCLQGLKLAPCLQHPQKLLGCLQVLTEELGSLVGALSFTRSMHLSHSANSANYVDAAVLVAQLFWQMSKVLWR